jgi:ankyrin repeat protein
LAAAVQSQPGDPPLDAGCVAGNDQGDVRPFGQGEPMRVLLIIPFYFVILLTGCGTGVNIWNAVEKEDLDAIARYAERGGDLNTGVTFYGKTPLLHALLLGKKRSYQKLLDLGADPNYPCGKKNLSTIHYAAWKPDVYWLTQALAANGDPNLMGENADKADRGTVLWWAVMGKNLENVRILIDSGAEVNAYAHNDETALAGAIDYPEFEIALLLLKSGADYQKKANLYRSAIYKLKEKMSIVKSSITHNQKPSYPESDLKRLDEIVEFLKADGFDPETAVWDGRELIWKQP